METIVFGKSLGDHQFSKETLEGPFPRGVKSGRSPDFNPYDRGGTSRYSLCYSIFMRRVGTEVVDGFSSPTRDLQFPSSGQ